MSLEIKDEIKASEFSTCNHSQFSEEVFTKDYVDFLNEAGWILEKKLPSNSIKYSDLLEDTDWKYNISDFSQSKHYRRDLDALS
tara:strand:+ start:347 stop:598 length:252 start_codon:yes stop_codon:yes gene_type:complete